MFGPHYGHGNVLTGLVLQFSLYFSADASVSTLPWSIVEKYTGCLMVAILSIAVCQSTTLAIQSILNHFLAIQIITFMKMKRLVLLVLACVSLSIPACLWSGTLKPLILLLFLFTFRNATSYLKCKLQILT